MQKNNNKTKTIRNYGWDVKKTNWISVISLQLNNNKHEYNKDSQFNLTLTVYASFYEQNMEKIIRPQSAIQ